MLGFIIVSLICCAVLLVCVHYSGISVEIKYIIMVAAIIGMLMNKVNPVYFFLGYLTSKISGSYSRKIKYKMENFL